MRKSFILSLLLTLWGMVAVHAAVIVGNGSQGTMRVADLNGGQSWTSVQAGEPWAISMSVENLQGNSYNYWGSSVLTTGSSAFPDKSGFAGFQIYLQSANNGGKLDLVFDSSDHIVGNVSSTDNFSLTIVYDGDKGLNVTSVNDSQEEFTHQYTLSSPLPAVSEFAYGLPTGINIARLMVQKPSVGFSFNTEGKLSDGRYTYTSPKQEYIGKANTLRFALTNSGAYYANGKNRMSLAEFYLYNALGQKVALKASWIKGNYDKNYDYMLDGNLNSYCAGDWSASDQGDDYFEISLPAEVDLGGAFSFGFVTENSTMWAKSFNVKLSYVEPTVVEPAREYTLRVDAPQDAVVQPTYDGQAVEEGSKYTQDEFDADLFSANEIEGYYWRVQVDKNAETISIKYIMSKDEVNPASVVALVERIGGKAAAENFKFVLNPALSSKAEKFVLGAEDGRILIQGSTLSALTTGLGWYLNHVAHINIAWNSLNEKALGDTYADLSDLPLPQHTEEHLCDAQYRYYLNYCTFGYSMTSWTWKRWQQEIDWMALHGINMPLQIIGLEEVWRKFLTLKTDGNSKYNYTDEEAKAFVAGPAYTAWWGMNNLEGWGGTRQDGWGGVQDDAWYKRQTVLAKKILDRQRELGMQPVLPGFSGMVPSNFTSKTGVSTDDNGSNWCGFTRPHIIDPTDARFASIAADYYACLQEVMGESQYYSMDPFHEGGSISSGKYTEAYKAVYEAMEAAKPNAQWVIQQWQWTDRQRLSVSAVPMGKLVVLDLFSDGSPAFDRYNGYAPQHAVFCALPNFGGRSGVMGRLNNLTQNYFNFKSTYKSIKGIGSAPEAIEQTPVTYDLIYSLPWMNGQQPDMTQWVDDYATSRYGTDNAEAKAVWQLLRQSVLNYGADAIQGPVEDVWAARPNLDASPASSWGVTLNTAGGTYTPARRQQFIDATYRLLAISNQLSLPQGSIQQSNYLYDLVEFGSGVMADYAYNLLRGIKVAREVNNQTAFVQRRDAFLALIADVDAFKGTNLNFRLGKWTQEARDAAGEVVGATTATPDWYEFNNARTLITVWGDQQQNGGLKDYSYRSWQGLMKDYYLPRWQYYFNNNCQGTDYFFFEWNWAHGMEHSVGQNSKSTTRLNPEQAGYSYSREAEGSTVEQAQSLMNKYILPVNVEEGIHYVYRYLDNDLTSSVSILAQSGTEVDLTPYFGSLQNVTVTGDFIEGSVTELSQIPVSASATDGSHIGKIALQDGTSITFAVVINPAYNGAYRVSLHRNGTDAPLFIAYNEDGDNAGNKGYKLLAQGTYSTSAQADQIFTLSPQGTGYTISAQGMYLKSTVSGWEHVMFSNAKADAGVYIMEAEDGYFKIHSTNGGPNYLNWYERDIIGNDYSYKEGLASFSLTPITSFPMTVSSVGFATLCLPFHVSLPDGVTAYDVTVSGVSDDGQDGVYRCSIKPIAQAGDVVKAGTPVIIKAAQGNYDFPILVTAQEAKTSLDGSLLRGNFASQMLTQGTTVRKYIFMKPEGEEVGFYRMQQSGRIGANKCWMEWTTPVTSSEVRAFVLDFQDETSIGGVEASRIVPSDAIYNIQGQRLGTPCKGLNIISGKVVLVK